MSIVTVSRMESRRGLRGLMTGFGVIFSLLTVLFLLFARRNWKSQKKVARANETNQVLGNSYYSIYRVDLF